MVDDAGAVVVVDVLVDRVCDDRGGVEVVVDADEGAADEVGAVVGSDDAGPPDVGGNDAGSVVAVGLGVPPVPAGVDAAGGAGRTSR